MKPLAIDLFCGLGGWSEGLLAENYRVVGFDIEQHVYGAHRYPAQLVVQDVLTLHGSQFKGAALIVASPPCQGYSYRAMPWKRAKALPPPCNALFDACFRIQREACEAAGHHIPLIVENVRGAQPWVGRARWRYGSFYLWGDVPALMPPTQARILKAGVVDGNPDGATNFHRDKCKGGRKSTGGSWFNVAHNTTSGKGRNPDGRDPMWQRGFTATAADGLKQGGDWFAEARKGGKGGTSASFGSKSTARKMASAMIAKIPEPLSRHIARTFYPR